MEKWKRKEKMEKLERNKGKKRERESLEEA
jgi:hypothetical protein